MRKSTKNRALIGSSVIVLCLALLVLVFSKAKSSKVETKTVIPSPTNSSVQVSLPQYRMAYNDNNGSVQNVYAEIKVINDGESDAKAVARDIEKKVCTIQCNISIFDDASALQLQYDYLQESTIYTPSQDEKWMKENYVFVADHYVGNHEFETTGDFTYYPFKNDSDYQKYKIQ